MYHVAYKIVPGNFTKEELEKEGLGGADAVIIVSLIIPPDGSCSEALFSYDGKTKQEVSDIELFKTMIMLANRLSQSMTLPKGQKTFCQQIFDAVKGSIMGQRRNNVK